VCLDTSHLSLVLRSSTMRRFYVYFPVYVYRVDDDGDGNNDNDSCCAEIILS